MRIEILVKTRAKQDIVEIVDGTYVVSVTVPPIQGKANKKIIDTLSNYFKVPKSNISIIKGELSRKKVIEINV